MIAGNLKLMEDFQIALPSQLPQIISQYSETGSTLVFTAINGKLAGFLALADTLREDASAVIQGVKETGISPVLLTEIMKIQPGILPVNSRLMKSAPAAFRKTNLPLSIGVRQRISRSA